LILVGDDWAEDHHDIEVLDEAGATLERRRLPEGLKGVAQLHELLAEHETDPEEVVIGIETDRGLWVASLIAAGYQVYAINPKVVARYRERHATSGAKSDPGDAKVLANLVRTDRHLHRAVAGDSELAEAIKVLARAHQRQIWARRRQVNALRATLLEFYPAALATFGNELAHPDALAVLQRAPTPAEGRRLSLSAIAACLRRGGRRRLVEQTAKKIQAELRSPQLDPPAVLAGAFGASVRASVAIIAELNRQIDALEAELARHFEQHPDAKILRSLPGLGSVLGARALGEFGDDPNRYKDARSRRCYAGTAPITVTSGKKKVVLARFKRNRRLGDVGHWWAFCALSHSPGARAFYDERRARGDTNDQALRALGNRLVGILDGCLRHRTLYDEDKAWGHRTNLSAGEAA
jgi:transposase